MRSRIIVGSLVLLGIGIAASRTMADPALKWAIVNLKDTTVIAGAVHASHGNAGRRPQGDDRVPVRG